MFPIKNSLIIILLINLLPSFASKEPKIYQIGILKNLFINSQTSTSYIASGSSSTSGSASASTSFLGNYANTYASGNSHTNSFGILSPITYVTNTYYFQIKLNNLTYVTSFTPRWKQTIDTNWIIGKPIKVRLNEKNNRMYIQKPSSKELKTKVLRIES